MEIKTKYHIGQVVWYIRSNSVVQGQIDKIVVNVDDKCQVSILYTGNWIGTTWKFTEYENGLFATKQDLLNAL